MNNYELHKTTHTCHEDCQNPICLAVREAVAAEREACAELCGVMEKRWWDKYKENGSSYTEGKSDAASECAAIIRARGQS